MSNIDAPDRVLVVGGGLAGLGMALRLAQAGRDVTLLESQAPGGEASTRNQGWLYSGALYSLTKPSIAHLYYVSLTRTQQYCPECLESGHDGMIYAVTQTTEIDAWAGAWKDSNIPFVSLSQGELKRRLPSLDASSVRAAFLLPDRAVRYDVLVTKLAHDLAEAGGELRTGTRVASLLRQRDHIAGIVTSEGEEIRGNLVILAGNATGIALNPRPTESTAVTQVAHRVVALKTQLAAATPGCGSWPLAVVDVEGFNHLPHGRTSIFGTDRWLPQSDPEDQRVDPDETALLWARMTRFFPDLAREEPHIETWAGVTLQAIQPGILHPALVPAPAFLDHSLDEDPVYGVISVFPGRATLWSYVADRAAEIVDEKE